MFIAIMKPNSMILKGTRYIVKEHVGMKNNYVIIKMK